MATATVRGARLRTPLTDLLGLEVPIVQSGMGLVAGPDLAAAVSEAGGLGILPGLMSGADELRGQIRRVRELTGRPFGVNLWLHPDVESPPDPRAIPQDVLDRVQGTLNRFRRRLDLPPARGRPEAVPDVVEEAFEVILEERVPVWSVTLGDPGRDRVGRCHELGTRVLAMTTSAESARSLADSGADAIVAQGAEAGGHRSAWGDREPERDGIGTFVLVPQVVDAVAVPVIAAGGVADGRGVLAALALGAAGVMLGTRFVASRESRAPDFWKRSLLERGGGATTLTTAFTGLPARAMRNAFADDYRTAGSPTLPALLQSRAAQDIFGAAAARADGEHFPQFAGESLALIDEVAAAGDIVAALVAETARARARLP
jgi:nitronate monooxygenase